MTTSVVDSKWDHNAAMLCKCGCVCVCVCLCVCVCPHPEATFMNDVDKPPVDEGQANNDYVSNPDDPDVVMDDAVKVLASTLLVVAPDSKCSICARGFKAGEEVLVAGDDCKHIACMSAGSGECVSAGSGEKAMAREKEQASAREKEQASARAREEILATAREVPPFRIPEPKKKLQKKPAAGPPTAAKITAAGSRHAELVALASTQNVYFKDGKTGNFYSARYEPRQNSGNWLSARHQIQSRGSKENVKFTKVFPFNIEDGANNDVFNKTLHEEMAKATEWCRGQIV